MQLLVGSNSNSDCTMKCSKHTVWVFQSSKGVGQSDTLHFWYDARSGGNSLKLSNVSIVPASISWNKAKPSFICIFVVVFFGQKTSISGQQFVARLTFCLLVNKSWILKFSTIFTTQIFSKTFAFLFYILYKDKPQKCLETQALHCAFHTKCIHLCFFATCNCNIQVYLFLPEKPCNYQARNLCLWSHLWHCPKHGVFPQMHIIELTFLWQYKVVLIISVCTEVSTNSWYGQ